MSQPNFAGKDAAHKLLEEKRKEFIAIGRRAFGEALLKNGTATADDAWALFVDGFPEDINPVCLGAVTRPFISGKMIVKNGFAFSKRKENHGREINVWKLVDREKVEQLIGVVAPQQKEEAAGELKQPSLF